MLSHRPRVVVLRGHSANPWDLRPWEQLRDRFDVKVLVTGSNLFDVEGVALERGRVRAMRDVLPPGRVGDLALRLPGDRYFGLAKHLEGADIVHSAELGSWFTMQAARLRSKLGYRLALTVWETIPFAGAYRNIRTRPYRRLALERADLFLPTTERARDCLLLEGAPAARLSVCYPGIDTDRFRADAAAAPAEHVILSPGRLVWEKGHQDVIRAVAALDRGIVDSPVRAPRVLLVGSGPEEERLKRYARDLGVERLVEFRPHVPYEQMPSIYSQSSCMVLASLPLWWWEEQFGMVIAEALASGTRILASTSGAIPEVAGDAAAYFAPGDWKGLAEALAAGPLSAPPGTRVEHPPELVARYSSEAAASRLADAYESLLVTR